MKVGIIADIHSNLPALLSVWEELESLDLLICAGDAVGYYAEPREVCTWLRQHGVPTVRGNHDAYVTGELEPRADRRTAYRVDWTREQLAPDHWTWLKSLPLELRFCWGRTRVRVRHASPWDEESYVYSDSSRLNELQLERYEYLVLGHTHYPMCVQCGDGFVVNPGSVGQPRDRNPMASYALLHPESGVIEFRRVAYDVAKYQERLTRMGWDLSMVEMLSRTA